MDRGKALGLCTGWFTQRKAPVSTTKMNSFRSGPSWSLTPELL